MSKIKLLTLSLLLSTFAMAQKDSAATTEGLSTNHELNRVVVTANKFPRKQALTGKVVSVINRDVLERSSGKTITELLNQQAGLTVIGAQNNLGTNQDVYMRGAALGRTLILIDGIPVYDPSSPTTAFDLNTVSLDNVEQIEIVKGAQSTLYGSDAVAGVINIITRKTADKKFAPHVTLAAGSFNSYKAAAGISGGNQKTAYNLQYTHLRSSGFSSATDSTGRQGYDRDGFKENAWNASVGTALSSKASIRFYAQHSRYNTELDYAAFIDDRDYVGEVGQYSLGTSSTINYGKGTLYFNYNYNNMDRQYLDDSSFVPSSGFTKFARRRYQGRSHFLEAYTRIGVIENLELLAGADYRFHKMSQQDLSIYSGPFISESKIGGDSARNNQASFYASALLDNNQGVSVELGGRINRHSEYGTNATYTFNPSFLVNERLKIFGNLASAYKVPAPYQLYDPTYGNKDLEPERSRTIEGGVQVFPLNGVMARVVYFNRNIKNGIDYNSITNRYFNYNTQKDHGLELDLNVAEGPFVLTANYTYVTGKVNAVNFVYDPATWTYSAKGDTAFNNLFRRPKHSLNATLGVQAAKQLYFSITGKWVGKRMEPVFGQSPLELDRYHTIDLYTEYRFAKGLKIFADLKNITDEKYSEVLGYNNRRFNFMAGMRLRID
jgi:vitamin B12 transporter